MQKLCLDCFNPSGIQSTGEQRLPVCIMCCWDVKKRSGETTDAHSAFLPADIFTSHRRHQ